MFGAAAVRKKKQKAAQNLKEADRGPYIKPFGPRFDPNELPYFKYKKALLEAQELSENISGAAAAAAYAAKKVSNNGLDSLLDTCFSNCTYLLFFLIDLYNNYSE